jgi:uncharacterized membrane protein
MRNFAKFMGRTFVAGFLLCLPLFGCLFVVIKLVGILLDLIKPFLDFLPTLHIAGVAVVDLAAMTVLLILCCLAGLITKTSRGEAMVSRLELRVLERFPIYRFFRRVSSIAAGNEQTTGTPVVVQLGEGKQIGFLIEQHAGGECTVFFPDSPTVLTGNVMIVRTARVEKLNAPRSEVARIISSFGVGTDALINRPKVTSTTR